MLTRENLGNFMEPRTAGMKKMLRVLGIAWVGLLLSPQSSGEYHFAGTLDETFEKTTVVIEASAQACHLFDVYVARTSEQRQRGLMFVRGMADTTGMLFVYRRSQRQSIWMKNTYIPLDIVFFAADGRIVNIHENAQPLTLKSRRSAEAVNYVLELNGGTSERLHIDTDSRVILPLPILNEVVPNSW